jgi:hypothetical protein
VVLAYMGRSASTKSKSNDRPVLEVQR